MKTISVFRFLFILAALFQSNLSHTQPIKAVQTQEGIIRDEIIFLEGTTLPVYAQTASPNKTLTNAPPPFAVFNSSLNGLMSRINNVVPNQNETKLVRNSIAWFRLPHYLDDTQEGYQIRIADKKSGNTVCQFALGKANNRAKLYKNNTTTAVFDDKYKVATLTVNGTVFCQIKLEKAEFSIQLLQSNVSAFDIFVKKADKL